MSLALSHGQAVYGYFALALGVLVEALAVPLPAEVALLGASFVAFAGGFSLPVVMAVAAAAAFLGDQLDYLLGRAVGPDWLERHGFWLLLTPRRLERATGLVERFGPGGVALMRVIPGFRVATAASFGAHRRPWPRFLVYDAIAAVAWAAVVGVLGFGAGAMWQRAPAGPGRAGLLAVVLVALIAVALLALRHLWWWGTAVVAGTWLRRLAWQWIWTAALSLGAVAIFAKITEDVVEHESTAFDRGVRTWVLMHRTPGMFTVFHVITDLGSSLVIGPALLVLALYLWRRTAGRVAIVALLGPGLGTGIFLGFKELVRRVRPPGALRLHELAYSFPSGHTTVSTAATLTAAYILWREGLAPKVPAFAAACGFAFLVGLSRIIVDVHWTTDVIGAWAVGLFVATVAAALYERGRGTPVGVFRDLHGRGAASGPGSGDEGSGYSEGPVDHR